MEGFFATLKRGINGVYHHVGKQHLHRYLSEFDYRHNIRKMNDDDRCIVAVKRTRGKRLMLKESVATKTSAIRRRGREPAVQMKLTLGIPDDTPENTVKTIEMIVREEAAVMVRK